MFLRLFGSLLTGFGARLALTAIALQLVLSFAHIHTPVAPIPHIAAQTAPSGEPTDAPQMAHDCAICANIAAFHGLDLAVSAVIAITVGWIMLMVPSPVTRLFRLVEYRFFHTRAPPAA